MSADNLSVVLAIKNEAEMLGKCLESVSWAEEIVVVIDDRTTDNSEEIARKFTNKVFLRKFDGFASQKNYAIDIASNDWILLLDADERCTNDLKKEIRMLLGDEQNRNIAAYKTPFKSILLGKPMNYGGWDETHIRMFRSSKARYSDKEIHEELIIDGPISDTRHSIEHHSHRTIGQIIEKVHMYSTFEAAHLRKVGAPRVNLWILFTTPIRFFLFYYIKMQGYRDGIEGFIEVILSRSFYQLLVKIKLWELQR